LKRALPDAEENTNDGWSRRQFELDLQRLIDLLRGDICPIVFSDNPITKTYDSLPMVLFRFETLLKLYEARELDWIAYFFPWVLVNEALSHRRVNKQVRVKSFNIACCDLMKCTLTYHDRHSGPGIKPFGTKGGDPATGRVLSGLKLLMHPTTTIAVLVCEISNAKTDISLRRTSTPLLENRSNKNTRRCPSNSASDCQSHGN
jgi:hypothetical protein